MLQGSVANWSRGLVYDLSSGRIVRNLRDPSGFCLGCGRICCVCAEARCYEDTPEEYFPPSRIEEDRLPENILELYPENQPGRR